jgi:hypothetical protein
MQPESNTAPMVPIVRNSLKRCKGAIGYLGLPDFGGKSSAGLKFIMF